MNTLEELTKNMVAFRDERDWKQFHTPKDMALSLVLEAAEVMEHFQWRSKEEVEKYIVEHKKEIGDELADVLHWVLLISHDLGIDLEQASKSKLIEAGQKYPVDKAKGKHTKYNQL